MYPYLRTAPTETISDLLDNTEVSLPSITVSAADVRVRTEDSVIQLGSVEVPISQVGKSVLADRFDVPSAFLLRQDPEFQEVILNGLISRRTGSTTFVYNDGGLVEARDPNTEVIAPSRLLRVVANVVGEDALVREYWSDAREFRLDVMVNDDHEAIFGDRKVGDFSQAGLRVIQNRKQNLAPSVQPYQYRLACTNGMTTRHDGLKVDARGQTVTEVLAEFEVIADLAFRNAQADMQAFYAMRSEKVDNPERTLLRMANDAGLPQRTVARLVEAVPLFEQEAEDDLSMFDLVNIITHQANDPSVAKRAGARLALEEAGGMVVSEHAQRCRACQSKLVH